MTGKAAPRIRCREGILLFDPDDPIYADHFPGAPVVPGTMILSGLRRAVARSTGGPPPTRVIRFRFRRFVGAGSYRYTLEAASEGIFCRLWDGSDLVAAGELAP
jgi:3-hydroxyacyl-[acyl-carrier-protein] dehydratase